MQVEIKVPSAGESVSEATVAQILKQSGSQVKKDEEILELETDKVNQAIFAPEAGKLTLTVNEGDTVTIGQVLGTVDTDAAGAAAEEPKQEAVAPEAPKQEAPPAPKQEEAPPATPTNHKARISEDDTINSFKHSAAAPQHPAPPKQESAPLPKTSSGKQERKRMSGLRKTIAKRLVEVKNQTAMLTTFNEADMSAVMEIRSQEKEAFLAKHGVKLGFMSFFVKAVCAALKEYPDINAFIDGDEIVYNETFDIGVAVSTDRGLMVPIIRNAGSMEFHEIEKKILDYANAAREGKLSIDDLSGGTFTITNGGTFGSLLSTPILNPPQSGILGMHSILKRPVAKDDNVVVRPMMYLALSYDHRIVDGKEAVGFLVHIKQSLEEPARLLLDF